MPRPVKLTPAVLSKAAKLKEDGTSWALIAQKLGVSRSSILTQTLKAYPALRTKPSVKNVSEAKLEAVKLLMANGWTLDKVAKTLGSRAIPASLKNLT